MSSGTTVSTFDGKKFQCALATCLKCGKETVNATGAKGNEELIKESLALGKKLNKLI